MIGLWIGLGVAGYCVVAGVANSVMERMRIFEPAIFAAFWPALIPIWLGIQIGQFSSVVIEIVGDTLSLRRLRRQRHLAEIARYKLETKKILEELEAELGK